MQHITGYMVVTPVDNTKAFKADIVGNDGNVYHIPRVRPPVLEVWGDSQEPVKIKGRVKVSTITSGDRLYVSQVRLQRH
jgi:hypothetical protein